MRSLRYLNAILTVVAILLALHLWTLWAGEPVGLNGLMAAPAHAKDLPVGLNSASIERKQIAELLKQLNHRTDELITLFRSGRARINVGLPTEKDGPIPK